MRARTLSSTLASQPRPTIRPRAQSCHPSTAAYVRQEQERHEQNLILRKLRSAEEAVSSLRALLVLEEEAYSSSSSSSDGGGYVEEDWEVVSRRKKKPAAGDRSSTLKKRRGQPAALVPLAVASPAELRVQQGLALAYVHQFILSVQSVLTAIRLELPSLGSLSASSAAALEAMADLLQQSSGSPGPEVLPAETGVVSAKAVGQGDTALASSWRSASNTMSDLYGKLDDSKRACLAKVAAELAALQNLLVQSSSPSPTLPAADPALPGLTRQASVREYFVAESDKIAQTLSATSSNLLTLSTEAADTLSAGLTRVVDEASELTTLLTQSSTVAFDEAARIYHAAVEGGRRRLLSYDELPEGWKNNQHILSGYRFIGIDRWGAILRSAFQFHNETINIHSHFFGFLSLVYISIFILPSSPAFATEDTHWGDKGIFILFVAAGMKCLLCSTAWHLLSGCATGGWHRGAACVDYVGISGLIAASVMGMEYYGLYCRPDLAAAYMTLSGVLGITGMIVPWQPWFNMRRYKMWRVAFFLGLAGSALMPVGHMGLLYGFKATLNFFSPVLPSIAAYLIGLSFYANQFPECAAPGRCDTLFSSHQVWHGAIVLAVWTHMRALMSWSHLPLEKLSCAI